MAIFRCEDLLKMMKEHFLEIQYGKLPYGSSPALILLATIDEEGDKKIKALATAFFAFTDGYTILITAAHAIANLSGKPLIAIGSVSSISLFNSKVVKSDDFDIALIFLDSEKVNKIYPNPICVQTETLNTNADSGLNAVYQMHGFPASKNKISKTDGLKANWMRVTLGATKAIPKESGFSINKINVHIFDISIKELINDNRQRDYRLRSFKGMSGSPVIKHNIEAGNLSGSLIGMFVEWHKKTNTAIVVPWVEIQSFIKLAIYL